MPSDERDEQDDSNHDVPKGSLFASSDADTVEVLPDADSSVEVLLPCQTSECIIKQEKVELPAESIYKAVPNDEKDSDVLLVYPFEADALLPEESSEDLFDGIIRHVYCHRVQPTLQMCDNFDVSNVKEMNRKAQHRLNVRSWRYTYDGYQVWPLAMCLTPMGHQRDLI